MRVWIEIASLPVSLTQKKEFHPLMRVWIEINYQYQLVCSDYGFTLL